jgi:aryl-alcohol dehydrogenase-like predicted oxidoreductase
MHYKLLGPSGLRVSELCLGTMTFGETWGWGASREESRKQFDLFAEMGGNFIDTSVNYTDGAAETFLGEFLKDAGRERFVVATKYTLTKSDPDPNSGGTVARICASRSSAASSACKPTTSTSTICTCGTT